MQITSHNRQKHFLYRDSALVIIITVSVLLLSAFIANMCSQLLEYNNFLYLPSSFGECPTLNLHFYLMCSKPVSRVQLSTCFDIGISGARGVLYFVNLGRYKAHLIGFS